jgi:hypothetical protein
MNYFYPRATNGTSTNFDTNELYVAIGKGPVTAKVSHSLSNYFGTANSVIKIIIGKIYKNR